MAEKIRDPETYYAEWKNDPNYLKHKEEALAEWRKNHPEKVKEAEKHAARLVKIKEIKDLERNTNRTEEQEQELENKRAELARLEAQIASEKQFNWTPWIGLGIDFTIIAGISIYLLVKGKIKKRNKS